MDDNLTAVLIVIVSMIGMICLRYLKIKGRDPAGLSPQEHAAIAQMAQTALRLEQRVVSLEKILDHEVPSWRSTPDPLYQQVG
jgi:phage shock protein B